jgi:hypothetical protein
MSKLDAYLEAERRGILPPDKAGLLAEARKRGIVGGQQSAPEQPGFTDRVGKAFQERRENVRETKAAVDPLVRGPYAVGQAIGFGGDIAFEGARALTPEPVREAIGKGAQAVGEFIRPVTEPVGRAYGEFKGQNPNIAAGLETGGNFLQLLGTGAGTKAAAPVVKRGAQATGKAVAPAAKAVADTTADIGRKANVKTVVPASEEVRKASGALFKKADEMGGILKPEVANSFYDDVLQIAPQTEAGKVFKGETRVSKLFDEIPSLKDKPLTLDAAKEIDEALGDLAYGTADAKTGKITSEGQKFLTMQKKLRKTIDEATDDMVVGGKEGFEILKQARSAWSTSLRLRDVERIIENADLYDKPATALRVGFRNLIRNDKKLIGYSDAEKRAIRQAAKTGIITDALRFAGSGLVPILAGVGGAAATGGAGVAAAIPAFALQQGANALAIKRQVSRAEKARRAVAERGGVTSQAVRSEGLAKLLNQKVKRNPLIDLSEKK